MRGPSTFIKLDRNIEEWRWYKDANTMRVFIDLLIRANVTNNDLYGITIHRGEVATSYPAIADRLGLTVKQVRTALGHLKRTGEVAVKIHPKFQVISIVNYDSYQSARAGSGAGKGQSKGSQGAGKGQRYKNDKNNKNDKNIDGASDAPLTGARPAAVGSEGDCYVEINGVVHRYPEEWGELAAEAGMTIKDYVRDRHNGL